MLLVNELDNPCARQPIANGEGKQEIHIECQSTEHDPSPVTPGCEDSRANAYHRWQDEREKTSERTAVEADAPVQSGEERHAVPECGER